MTKDDDIPEPIAVLDVPGLSYTALYTNDRYDFFFMFIVLNDID